MKRKPAQETDDTANGNKKLPGIQSGFLKNRLIIKAVLGNQMLVCVCEWPLLPVTDVSLIVTELLGTLGLVSLNFNI